MISTFPMHTSKANALLFSIALMLLTTLSTFAAVPPPLPGDVYVGKFHTPHEGDVALIWIFDGNQFQELIFFRNSGRLQPLAASTVERVNDEPSPGAGHYLVALGPECQLGNAEGSFHRVRFDAQHVEIKPGGKKLLKISNGSGMTSHANASDLNRFPITADTCTYGSTSVACCADCYFWDVPPDLTPPDAGADYYLYPVDDSFRAVCCDACYGVHDLLGIHAYDCICCAGACRIWGFRCNQSGVFNIQEHRPQ